MPSDKVKDRLRKARAASKRKVVDYGQHPLIRDQERRGMPNAEVSGYRPRVADWVKDTFGGDNVRRVIKDRIKNPGKILSAPVVAAMGAVEGVKNAAEGVKHFLDPKTAPHPGDTRADAMSARKAFDVAGVVGGGGAVAKAASKVKPAGKATRKSQNEQSPNPSTAPPAQRNSDLAKKINVKSTDIGIVAELPDDVKKWPAGEVIGYLDKFDKELAIKGSYLDESLRGQGLGLEMYKRLIDEAHRRGIDVKSDRTVSNHAEKIYDKLKREGYDVRRNPKAGIEKSTLNPNRPGEYDLQAQRVYDRDKMHVFRVAKPGTKKKGFYSSGVPGLYLEDDRKSTAERLRTARQRARHGKR